MEQEFSVPALISVLSEQSLEVWGVVQSRDGACLEVSISCSLPVGTPISIQTSSDLFRGHIVAKELDSVDNAGANLRYGIYLDHYLPLENDV